jgi:HEAT repeat protein
MDTLDPCQLVELLGDDDFQVAGAASDALFTRGKAALDALIDGLKHVNGRVRASCALLMDHLGDDRCAEPLCHALRHDPLEAVRRCALHSLACQNCKECPLQADVIGPILEAALTDRSKQVRRRALQYLVGQRPDARVLAAVETIRQKETDPVLLLRARRALEWHQQEWPE